MAEVYVKGTVANLAIQEGDTDKGHWVRQDVVINEVTQNGLGRPLHFQITGQDRINMVGLQIGQTYVFHFYLESREGRNRDGNPMWFDSFNFGGTFTEYHFQCYNQCMYQLRSPTFVQDYQARMQGYASGQQHSAAQYPSQQPTAQYGSPQGYPQQPQQGYGYQQQPTAQYGAPQGYPQQPQQPQGYDSNAQANKDGLPF